MNNKWIVKFKTSTGYGEEDFDSRVVINDTNVIASKAYKVVATVTVANSGTITADDIAAMGAAATQTVTLSATAALNAADASDRLHVATKTGSTNTSDVYADGAYFADVANRDFSLTLTAGMSGAQILGYVLIWFDGRASNGSDVVDTAAPSITLDFTGITA